MQDIKRWQVNWVKYRYYAPLSFYKFYILKTHISFNKILNSLLITHWGQDKMAVIYHTAFSNGFFLNENVCISITIALNFVPRGPNKNIPASL